MTFSSEFIDEIVRNVMRELNLPSTSAPAAPAPPSSGSAVTLTSDVITEDTLANHGVSGGSIVLPPGAVITPSGRDYLRRYQITVSSVPSTATSAATGGLVLITGEAANMTAAAKSVGWDITGATGCFDAANQTAQRCSSQPTVCCSAQPSVIACLINRNCGRRAAVLTTDTCQTELFDEMNPDTICLSPTGWSFGQLMQLLKRLGSRSTGTPATWKEL